MSHQSTVCWLQHYCRWVTGVPAFSPRQKSEHRVNNTVITETQGVLLAKVKDQNNDHRLRLTGHPNEKQQTMNFMYRWWKKLSVLISRMWRCPWLSQRNASLPFFGPPMPQLVPPWQWGISWRTGVCWSSATYHIARHWWHKKEYY